MHIKEGTKLLNIGKQEHNTIFGIKWKHFILFTLCTRYPRYNEHPIKINYKINAILS